MTLQKAQIVPEKGATIEAMFNPDNIVYIRSNKWKITPTNGQVLPEVGFTSSVPAILKVTLIFDGTEDGTNVAVTVDKLAALTRVSKDFNNGKIGDGQGSSTPSQSKQQRPPTVQFLWGSYLSFRAIIDSITTTFSLFLDDGSPVRASVAVQFTQIEDKRVFPEQNPTSAGRTGERVHRLGPRETLDQVAYANFGHTGLWRALAAFNGIDDPLRVQAGDAILLPASADDLKSLA